MPSTDSAPSTPPQHRDRSELIACLASVAALAVALTFTVGAILHEDPADARRAAAEQPAADRPEPTTVVQRGGRSVEVATSFGVLVVHQPHFIAGVPARALAGQNHGIQDHVTVDRQLVQVPVTLYNGGDSPMRHDARHFSLVTRGTKGSDSPPQEPASSTIHRGRLQPGASIDGVLGFVVARKGAPLVLLFHEHRAGTYRVALQGTGSQYRRRPGDRIEHTASSATTGTSHHGHERK